MKITQSKLAVGAATLAIAFLAGTLFSPMLAGSAAAQVAGPSTQLEDRGPVGGDALKTAADLIGITVAQLRTEMGTDKSMADVAVAHGKTRDALIAALTAVEAKRIADLVDHKGAPWGPRPGGPGFGGPGGPGFGGPGRPGGPGFGVRADPFPAAAAYLGISPQDIQTKLRAGQTLAQIATAAGKTRDGLIAAIVQDETARIDQAVKDGKLTADQAARAKTGMAERVTRLVDHAAPPMGPRGGRP